MNGWFIIDEMAQVLKAETRERIAAAALEVFATRGYPAASMAEIARRAGCATGNLYRYHASKRELFRALVGPDLAERFADLARRMIRSLDGVDDLGALAADAPYFLLSEEALAFCVANRRAVVILLARAQGTEHEGFGERHVERMVRLSLEHVASLGRAPRDEALLGFTLRQIHRGVLETLVTILARFEAEEAIRGAIRSFTAYHLAGLRNLFQQATRAARPRQRRGGKEQRR